MATATLEADRIDTPTMGNCPAGGNHAPIPIQGGGGNRCAKCGADC